MIVHDRLPDAFVDALREAAPTATIEQGAPLARFTTMRVGGPADVLVSLSSPSDVAAVVGVARAHGVPVTVLGGGSNVLVADAGIRGLTLRIHGGEVAQEGPLGVRADAGVTINGLVRWLAGRGLAGLEAWAGTPGTVGGAICGNAHFQGRLISEHVRSVRVLSAVGRDHRRACRRDGIRLRPQPHPDIRRGRAVGALCGDAGGHARRASRRGADVAGLPQAHPAAAPGERRLHLPEPGRGRAGAGGGASIGGGAGRSVPVSRARSRAGPPSRPCTPTSSSSTPGSRAADVRALVDRCRDAVAEASGVRLDEEIVYLGDWNRPSPSGPSSLDGSTA